MREIVPGLYLLPCRAALLERSRTLLVADAHLGFTHVLRRRGALLPPLDLGLPRELREAVRQTGAKEVIFLGDVVEAPRPSKEEKRHVREVFASLGAPVHVVLGNHDRGLIADFPDVSASEGREVDGFFLRHGDKPPPPGDGPFVLGHFHPALRFSDAAGVSHLFPAAVAGERGICLPAASPFSRGLAITPRDAPPALTAWTGPLLRAVVAA